MTKGVENLLLWAAFAQVVIVYMVGLVCIAEQIKSYFLRLYHGRRSFKK